MSDSSGEDTAKEKIYLDLRRSIIMGHLQPGERLSLQDLAVQYGISVSPVRDALQMLGQEGLITIKPRSGYFVTRITLKQLRDIMEMREILEVAAVERAAVRISEAQLEELRHVHGAYTGDDDASYDRYTDENRRFHWLIGVASGNFELAEQLGRVHDRLARFMVLRHAGKTQVMTHARIADALAAHDTIEARASMLAELDETRDALLDRIMREEGSNWHLGAHTAS